MTARRPSDGLVIALDAAVADRAAGADQIAASAVAAAVVAGAARALKHYPGNRFLLFGDEAAIAGALAAGGADMRALAEVAEVRPAPLPAMPLAVDALQAGAADCVVSGAPTGALTAAAAGALPTLAEIDRPAVAWFFPTRRGESVMLDLGAQADCGPAHLVQFALMGALFAETVLGLVSPSIGVLTGASEALKGHEVVSEAVARLSAATLPGRFHGLVQGDDIAAGTVDVVVTDGFTGNVARKAAAGAAALSQDWQRRAVRSSPLAGLGHRIGRSAFTKLGQRVDPRRYDGAAVLGLQGLCVRAPSLTDVDAIAIANAIGVAVDLLRGGFNDRLSAAARRLRPDTVGGAAATRAIEMAGA